MEINLFKFNPKILEQKRIVGCSPAIAIIGDNVDPLLQHLLLSLNIPSDNIFIGDNFEPIFNKQKNHIRDINETGESPRDHREIDICIVSGGKITKNKNIWYNNRSYNISIIITTTHKHKLSPDVRTNLDFVFIDKYIDDKDDKYNYIKKIYDFYFRIFPTFEDFKKVFDACISNNCYMVIDNTSKSNNIEDVVFWFKEDIQVLSPLT